MTTILNFKQDGLVMIDHQSKSYVEVKLSEWEREVAKRLKDEFPGIKPNERKIVVRKTGKTAVINGFQTEQIEVLADDELIEENWMTRDVEMKEIEQVMDRLAHRFPKDFRLETKEGREIYEKLKPYGFSILIKDHAATYGLRAIDRVEVKKIEKKELKDDLFLPPAGYQRIIPGPSKK
jgi:predicted enzyme involved in methoxymalonyl-ACP biosynthesis